ncbi:hypothetical protein CGMCC3_g11514 [Colletotrichum fructicola]|nr:uncharacterized protein CGMCC3_g11514 [Colletotrichum fructicola]KAE9572490.1 hypothetical protein CGMCC3_g11514 [Colletotrichum fructicola]
MCPLKVYKAQTHDLAPTSGPPDTPDIGQSSAHISNPTVFTSSKHLDSKSPARARGMLSDGH